MFLVCDCWRIFCYCIRCCVLLRAAFFSCVCFSMFAINSFVCVAWCVCSFVFWVCFCLCVLVFRIRLVVGVFVLLVFCVCFVLRVCLCVLEWYFMFVFVGVSCFIVCVVGFCCGCSFVV